MKKCSFLLSCVFLFTTLFGLAASPEQALAAPTVLSMTIDSDKSINGVLENDKDIIITLQNGATLTVDAILADYRSNLTIQGNGTVIVSGRDSAKNAGLFVGGKLTVKDGASVQANGLWYGVYANGIEVLSGGKLHGTATLIRSENDEYQRTLVGINSRAAITVDGTGSTLSASVANAEDMEAVDIYAYDLYSGKMADLTISNGAKLEQTQHISVRNLVVDNATLSMNSASYSSARCNNAIFRSQANIQIANATGDAFSVLERLEIDNSTAQFKAGRYGSYSLWAENVHVSGTSKLYIEGGQTALHSSNINITGNADVRSIAALDNVSIAAFGATYTTAVRTSRLSVDISGGQVVLQGLVDANAYATSDDIYNNNHFLGGALQLSDESSRPNVTLGKHCAWQGTVQLHRKKVNGAYTPAYLADKNNMPVSKAVIKPVAWRAGNPGWSSQTGKRRYYDANGAAVYSTWEKIDGKWYLFDAEGFTRVGWYKNDTGKWFYLNKDGAMHTGWLKLGKVWYYLNKDGHMLTGGYHQIGNAWHQFRSNGTWAGKLKSGRFVRAVIPSGPSKKAVGAAFYKNGTSMTGWVKVNGDWYYLSKNGKITDSQWIRSGGGWYYVDWGGKMLTGHQLISGRNYYFGTDGRMRTGWAKDGPCWYHFNRSGKQSRNTWIESKGKWYYLTESGTMAVGVAYDSHAKLHLFDATGVWQGKVDN